MISNNTIFKYIPKDSKIHKMNSKMKILWFLLTLLSILISKDFITTALLLIFLLFIILNTKIKFSDYLLNILVLWPFYSFIFLLTFIITFNLYTACFIMIKIILIIILFLILTSTTSISEIAWGFECLFTKLKKIKIPVSKISLRIAFSIKFVSTLFNKAKEIKKSMAYRGVPYSKNKIKFFKIITPSIIRLSYKLSLRTLAAMKLRFYGYSKKRTNYHENKVTKFDKKMIFIDAVLLYLIIWLGWLA